MKYGHAENNTLIGNRVGVSIGHRDTDNLVTGNDILQSRQVGVFFRPENGKDFAGHRNRIGNSSGSVTSASAVLSLLSIDVNPGLTIIGPVGTRYRIDYALEANAASWTTMVTLTLPSSPYTFSDFTTPVRTKRFYRVVAQP